MEMHRTIYRRILEMAVNMSMAFGCSASMETVAIVPAVENSPEVAAVVREQARQVVSPPQVLAGREMASEDMGHFLEEIPGCYFFVGSRNEAAGYEYPHHHPQFDFDERAMITGVDILARSAAYYLTGDFPQTWQQIIDEPPAAAALTALKPE
jgi:amidohydrolase